MNDLIPCRVVSLGKLQYLEAWALQKRLAAARGADEIPDMLLWVEHPHTYTLGSSGNADNVLLSAEEVAARRIELHRVDRGGDVTYHGPGQLVGYPILKLARGGDGLHADVISYVRGLEQMLIGALAIFGITACVYPGLTGVWVNELASPAKIAAIGVRVTSKRVTMHGFALNVNTDLDYFKGIIPCGIADKSVTSMARLLGQMLDMDHVSERVGEAFAAVFARSLYQTDAAV